VQSFLTLTLYTGDRRQAIRLFYFSSLLLFEKYGLPIVLVIVGWSHGWTE